MTSDLFGNRLLTIAPALAGIVLGIATPGTATEVGSFRAADLQTPVAGSAPILPASVAMEQPQNLRVGIGADIGADIRAEPGATTLDEVMQYTGRNSNAGNANPVYVNPVNPNSMAQVTSVDQFTDVEPTDWAYQALQSLVERYNCIVGYPDSTYRGQRALTRYEFAAGLNACLDRISELIAASTADLATKEDLATLQRLQEEFASELAALRGRIDVLEGRTANLEANQFSTTTKLTGETIFGAAQAFGGGSEDDDTDLENQVLASGRVRLAFDTSFSGDDRLRARLQAGDFGRFLTTDDAGNTVLGSEARLGFDTDTDNDFEINHLSYLFPIGDQITAMLAAEVSHFGYFDFIDTVSPFNSSGRGAISRFGRFNPIYRTGTGTGAGISFDFIDQVGLQLAYLAGDAGDPSPAAGLFNGDYAALAQLTIKPFDALTLAFTYVNSYAGTVEEEDGEIEATGLNTGTGSRRSRVQADVPIVANSYGVEANLRVARFLQLGGWAGFSAIRAIETGDADVWNYAATIGFPDLGGRGNLLGFVVGMQPRLTGTTGFSVNDRRRDPDVGLHVEGFYRFQLNDNISITPGVIWLTAPDHDSDNKDVVVGAIRTTFTF